MAEVQLIVRKEVTTIIHSGENRSAAGIGGTQVQIDSGVNPIALIGKTITFTRVADGATFDHTITAAEFFFGTILITVNPAFTYTIPAAAGTFTFVVQEQESKVTFLDLWPDEIISQNWKFTDISQFQSLGSFTRQFRIPATDVNITAIGAMFDPNYNSTNNYFHQKLPAEIRVDYMAIASGYLRVMRTYRIEDIVNEFEVCFYAETPDLFRAITNKKLADIQALAALNHPLNYDTAQYNGTDPNMYALTDYGQKWSENGQSNSRRVFTSVPALCPRVIDLTPCVKWSFLFRNIIEEAGFELDAEDLLNILDEYWMPFLNKGVIQYEESDQALLWKYGLTTNYTFSGSYEISEMVFTSVTEYFDNANSVSGGIFTPTIRAKYKFRFWFTAINGYTFAYPYTMRIRRVSDNAVLWSLTIQSTAFQVATRYINTDNPIEIELNTGEAVKFTITTFSQTELIDNTFMGTFPDGGYYGSGIELIGATILDNGTVDYQKNAPNFSQTQFVQDVLNMHCCAIIPDRVVANKVKVVPMQTFLAAGVEDDWTDKIDYKDDVVLTSTADEQSTKLRFTYSAGQDIASKTFVEAANRTYGDYYVIGYTASENDLPNAFAKDGEMKVALTTESTPAQYIDGTSIVIPKFINGTGDFVSPNMRCLYSAGTAIISMYDYSTSSVDTTFEVPLINHYSVIEPTLTDYDLNFAPETPLHIVPANPVNNLFNLYWRDYINNTYSPEARIMEASFALDLTDILTFRFNTKYWIKDSWWRILEVNDYKIGQYQSTRVRLMKIVDTPETSSVPVDTEGPNGVVLFETRMGEPTAATQSSCERFGYFWDAATNTCRANGYANKEKRVVNELMQIGLSTNEIKSAQKSIVMTDGLNNDIGNQYSLMVGSDIIITEGNQYTAAIGEHIRKEQPSGGAIIGGRNAYVATSGIHFGGGWLRDNRSEPNGQLQFGFFNMANATTFTPLNPQIELFLDGDSAKPLNLPDNTMWMVHINLFAVDDLVQYVSNTIYKYQIGKYNGVISAQYAQMLYQDDNGLPLDLYFDLTDGVNHRLYVDAGTLTSTYNDVTINAYIQYTQINVPKP